MGGMTLSAEDLEFRRRYIGASDVPIILGLDPYTSPAELLRKKVLGEVSGYSDEAYWGNRLEPVVVDEFFRWHSDLRRVKQRERRTLHPKIKFTGFTPDAIGQDGSGQLVVVQVKTTGLNNLDDWLEGPPPKVRAQAQWEAWVLAEKNRKRPVAGTWVVALVGGQTYMEHFVPLEPPAPETLAKVTGFYADLLQALEHGLPPHESDWGEPLELQPPAVKVSPDLDLFCEQYLEEKAEVQAAEDAISGLRADILRHIPAGHLGVVTPGYRVSMVRSKRSPVPYLKVTRRVS